MLPVTSITVGIPMTDLRAAQRWYEAGLEVDGPDLEPVQEALEYRVGGTWLQLVETGSPGGVTVRIGVPDVHEQHGRLMGPGSGAGTSRSSTG